MNEYYKRILAHIQKAARKIVSEKKKRCLAPFKKFKPSPQQRHNAWPHNDSEIEISEHSQLEDIENVLKLVDCWNEQDFIAMQQKALAEVEQPEYLANLKSEGEIEDEAIMDELREQLKASVKEPRWRKLNL